MKGQRIRFLFSLLMLFLSMSAFAQQITVSGKVTDSDQEPIIGASVIEKGTSNGMITDMDGNFSLKTSPNATITISYIGYQTVEVRATEKPLRIVLKDDSELLDEVIVIGYGTMQKKDVTTSVATVSTKELNQRPICLLYTSPSPRDRG